MAVVGQVVAVVNQKGGVGKSTVTLGLASAAAHAGHKVLVVDADPQGAATHVLGLDVGRLKATLPDALGSSRSGSAASVVQSSPWGHLVDVVPAGPRLQQLEAHRSGLDGLLFGDGADRLRRSLSGVTRGYGVVLVDCPPSLGALTTNALVAADQALVVVEPAALSLRGVEPVADLIDEVWERHGRRLDLAGVVVNRVPARGHDAAERYEELARSVGRKSVWEPTIPQRVVLAEAASARRPIHELGARARDVADVFDQLYAQLWRRIRPRRR